MSDLVTVGYICTDEAALTSCLCSLDRELGNLSQGSALYSIGMIGQCHVALSGIRRQEKADVSPVAKAMKSNFPKISLLILVSSEAGVVPRPDSVRLGDVVVPSKSVTKEGVQNIDLKPSILLDTASRVTGTSSQWSLRDAVQDVLKDEDHWAEKCTRPVENAGDERANRDALLHYTGVVISDGTYPETARYRDLIVRDFNPDHVACFDNGYTSCLHDLGPDIDVVSVLGVSHYCDENSNETREEWGPCASVDAAAGAKEIVLMNGKPVSVNQEK